jgi:hypothetical protein
MQFSEKVLEILTEGYVFYKEFDSKFNFYRDDEEFQFASFLYGLPYSNHAGCVSGYDSFQLEIGNIFLLKSTCTFFSSYNVFKSEVFKNNISILGYVNFHKTNNTSFMKMALYKKPIDEELEKELKFYLKLLS